LFSASYPGKLGWPFKEDPKLVYTVQRDIKINFQGNL